MPIKIEQSQPVPQPENNRETQFLIELVQSVLEKVPDLNNPNVKIIFERKSQAESGRNILDTEEK